MEGTAAGGAAKFLDSPPAHAREGGTVRALHRTYLAPGGAGKAPVEPAGTMLGACAGGAVRLAEPPAGRPAPLVAVEGIETALSLASGLLSGPARVGGGSARRGCAASPCPPRRGG